MDKLHTTKATEDDVLIAKAERLEVENIDIEKVLREGKEVIFQEEREKRSLQKFTEKFRELQAKSKADKESK